MTQNRNDQLLREAEEAATRAEILRNRRWNYMVQGYPSTHVDLQIIQSNARAEEDAARILRQKARRTS